MTVFSCNLVQNDSCIFRPNVINVTKQTKMLQPVKYVCFQHPPLMKTFVMQCTVIEKPSVMLMRCKICQLSMWLMNSRAHKVFEDSSFNLDRYINDLILRFISHVSPSWILVTHSHLVSPLFPFNVLSEFLFVFTFSSALLTLSNFISLEAMLIKGDCYFISQLSFMWANVT